MKRICVYCGSSPGKKPEYIESAQLLAKEMVKRNIGLVYGGASVGIMGEIADTVLENGGEVLGIMPRSLFEREISHVNLTELKVVDSMHERKALMAASADGFIALPGGFGTLEELFEVLTWSQLGFHRKPCGVLNTSEYYNHLSAFLDHAAEEQFIKGVHRDILLNSEDPVTLLDLMASYRPTVVDKLQEIRN